MPESFRVHIAYALADAHAYEELSRHLSSILSSLSKKCTLGLSHSGEFASLEEEATSAVVEQADLILLLVSPRFALAARPLIEKVPALTGQSADQRRVVPIQLETTAWPSLPRTRFLPRRAAIDEFPNRDLAFFEVAKGLRPILEEELRSAAKRPAQPLRAARETSGRGVAEPKPLTELPKNRYALLVGVNRFLDGRAFPSLNFCVNDVRTLGETLDQAGYLVRLVHDEMEELERKPFRENVRYHLEDICTHAEPEDLVLVHFACHGFVQAERQFLAVYDTRQHRAQETALALSDIEAELRKSPARRRVLVLDACHAGAHLHRGSEEEEYFHYVFEQAEGFVRIAASTAQQKAQEWRDKRMGAFSYFWNEALRGDRQAKNAQGMVTVQSAANYVLFKLRKWTFDNLGRPQEPTLQYEGLGEMVLADLRGEPDTEPR